MERLIAEAEAGPLFGGGSFGGKGFGGSWDEQPTSGTPISDYQSPLPGVIRAKTNLDILLEAGVVGGHIVDHWIVESLGFPWNDADHAVEHTELSALIADLNAGRSAAALQREVDELRSLSLDFALLGDPHTSAGPPRFIEYGALEINSLFDRLQIALNTGSYPDPGDFFDALLVGAHLTGHDQGVGHVSLHNQLDTLHDTFHNAPDEHEGAHDSLTLIHSNFHGRSGLPPTSTDPLHVQFRGECERIHTLIHDAAADPADHLGCP